MDEYRNIAPVYDAVTRGFLRGPRQRLVETCAGLGARRVLDAGCGTGLLTRMLRERAELAVGLDRSAAMLTAGARGHERQKAAYGGEARDCGAPDAASRLLFVQGDVARPPFAPKSFDALVYSLILHETTADAGALLEAGFALAPLALVLEWRMPERNLDFALTFWVPVIERLAGREHYRQFRAFMRAGGVRGLARRVGARILLERSLAGNSLVLAVLCRD